MKLKFICSSKSIQVFNTPPPPFASFIHHSEIYPPSIQSPPHPSPTSALGIKVSYGERLIAPQHFIIHYSLKPPPTSSEQQLQWRVRGGGGGSEMRDFIMKPPIQPSIYCRWLVLCYAAATTVLYNRSMSPISDR